MTSAEPPVFTGLFPVNGATRLYGTIGDPIRQLRMTGIMPQVFAAVGAIVGALFPPAILGMAAAGGFAGGLLGHLWHGMSRGDVKDLGEALDAGTAAIVVVGKTSLKEKLEKATAKAVKRIEKQLKGDEKAFEKELAAAEKAAA